MMINNTNKKDADELYSDMVHTWKDLRINSANQSNYIRTTWMLSAKSMLMLPKLNICIRFFNKEEAQALFALVKKRNVFARHSWENNFYLQRVEDLADITIINIIRTGNPDDIIDEVQITADLIEKLVFLSSTLVMSKKEIQRLLAISPYRRTIFDLTIGPKCNYIKSKSRSEPVIKGIIIDEKFCRRFERCGFPHLALLCTSDYNITERIISTINWLFESRQEPQLSASIVKTSIALESLLISSESEPLAKSLSERAAFILSSEPDIRHKISKIVKKFYDARSGVVHGSRKKSKMLTPNLVEGMDRLVILLCLTIASNSDKWDSMDSLLNWCESQRWGTSVSEIIIPFPNIYLKNAIKLFSK
jgi:hypothetical protein